MKILSLNSGSSTLKFQLYDMPEEKVLVSGNFEKIGSNDSFYRIQTNNEKIVEETFIEKHKIAIEIMLNKLVTLNIISSLEEINGVGHRIVQGGEYFKGSTKVDDEVIKKCADLIPLAPLHNKAAVTGMELALELMPNATSVAVFDTAFHQTMPEYNYLYALPYSWYKNHRVRRFGFHGTSHKYVSLKMNEILGKSNTKLITCHIGNGASICAIENGISINTSMGLTPNAGLIMGTRSGDIDATIITYIMEQTNMTSKEIETILNKESGFLGISEKYSDSRDIEDGIANNDEKCILAQKMYTRRIVDYIAKYYVELGGCDAIIFTAGLGEKSILTRIDVMNELSALGIVPDEELNNTRSVETIITKPESKIPCYVIPTDEELMIARDTFDIIK